MRCEDARPLFLDAEHNRLAPAQRAALDAHIAQCSACAALAKSDRILSGVLETRLPQHAAPFALKRRLRVAVTENEETPSPRRAPLAWAAVAAAVVLGLGVSFWVERDARAVDAVALAAVEDHLLIARGEQPLQVRSGGIHQVKPWFTGKIDFAPVLAFAGDDEFVLEGGRVSTFLDRQAAVFEFKRRLHAISLFVFRADGVQWPLKNTTSLGRVTARTETSRGFSLILWRQGDLAYVAVSDLNPTELRLLAAKIAGGE